MPVNPFKRSSQTRTEPRVQPSQQDTPRDPLDVEDLLVDGSK
jgi:hypothetical protein